ncbi:hypothetical protein [uncultured Imperialibacter sp.]|uniref:hypothetical protein n=1 Tax=uncultured Imperialibacter sp. TaxID=1672639 RepID=UPI0030D6F797|tara:strand:+ start:2643 stop:3461 length:819 start_codon:yes stop_codon:yes gene_type:complete
MHSIFLKKTSGIEYFDLRTFTVAFVIILLVVSTRMAYAQEADSTNSVGHLSGAVTATNNGISLLPAFSLGKPAFIFDMNVGKKRLTFEPQLRFAMTGRPWSFIFWWRYKIITGDKFKLHVGAHPAFTFQFDDYPVNGVPTTLMISRQFAAGEIVPRYTINKKVTVGLYYLQAHGFQSEGTQNTYFFATQASFSEVRLGPKLLFGASPQLYYLQMDDKRGYYASSTFSLALNNFPLSLQSIMSRSIGTELPGKDFIWNISLIYSFAKEYAEKR